MATIYLIFVEFVFSNVFSRSQSCGMSMQHDGNSCVTLKFKVLLLIVLYLLVVIYHCRLIERTSRLDFLWKLRAHKELHDMRELSLSLPELYAQSYANCVVLFGSIPNFANIHTHTHTQRHIRLLNEIIFDFDQLLEDEQFTCIEKIKTISSTYMAAAGLNPRDQGKSIGYLLASVADLALSMKDALEDVNKHSFNNFKLRIGLTHGPVVGGVIGAKKPVYDIWGNTVNEASRMDSTGNIDQIQIPKASAVILETEGFRCQYRGLVAVKGKGDMETYYLVGRKIERSKSCGRSQYGADGSGGRHSMTAVLSAMVQNRKKQSLGSSLSVPSNKHQQQQQQHPQHQQLRPRGLSSSTASGGLSSLSFNFRKSARNLGTHRLNRMRSEMSSTGRSKHRTSTTTTTTTGFIGNILQEPNIHESAASSHSVPDIIKAKDCDTSGSSHHTIINI
ncbi:adenylate cyclase type 8-like [Oppia nitens]|uniref:adenylate cyclase type 8-like n=1 Tax=Oppia nitens TaxID=1686743 RepID=UPI0023D9A284|nr:adenylate cyclase type 8-like [Oppia nitens]